MKHGNARDPKLILERDIYEEWLQEIVKKDEALPRIELGLREDEHMTLGQ
jgi:hypothetical protein